MKLPKTFDKAEDLLGLEKLPDDAKQQLDALMEETPEKYKKYFKDYYEALHVREGE